MAIDTSKTNACFCKQTRRDLKRSQIHFVNFTGVPIQLFLHNTCAAHAINVEHGDGIEAPGGGGVNGNRLRSVVIDRSTGYGRWQSMFLLADADYLHDVPIGFQPEVFVVAGTVDKTAGAGDMITLRNGCKQNVPGEIQLDVMPGFLQSPASDPCTLDQAESQLATTSRADVISSS